MPRAFISYSHDPDAPEHAERVARLAASLLRDGVEVFLDQNRGPDEEGVPWPIWMEDKIEIADRVLIVCTEFYRRKLRREVPEDVGRGVLWEANLIYNQIYIAKLNTTKFVPVVFSRADAKFIPGPLAQTPFQFSLDEEGGYTRLYAFLTGQHRLRFPNLGGAIALLPERVVEPLFPTPAPDSVSRSRSEEPAERAGRVAERDSGLSLKAAVAPARRNDVRGLDWYDECDAGHFLGRDKDANTLLSMLLSHPVVRLVGPSGVGKSSLIRAGLLPKIREFRWRACVVRPFEDPARRVLPQLDGELLAAGSFTAPFEPEKFRAEVSPLLANAGETRLLLLFDQFEDIVSPLAAPGAVDYVLAMLREIWEMRDARPYLRAAVAYRTDADARLARLWQAVSGRSEGLPYLALEGLTADVADQVIAETAAQQGWELEVSVADITRQLVQESRTLENSSDVFPVYLQIFLKQAQEFRNGRITQEYLTSLGGVSGLLSGYLEQTLARLKKRGGDWEHCDRVLEILCRSTGTRSVQSLDDLIRESELGRPVLAEMLRVLVDERLVRPVGHERYEIQHDRLASAVISGMGERDRAAKAARDFLAAKVATFEGSRAPLTPEDLVHLYRYRSRIRPTERELQILFVSLEEISGSHPGFATVRFRDGGASPGWYWFRNSSAEDWFHRFVWLERWLASSGIDGAMQALWINSIPVDGLEASFRSLATDPHPQLRALAAEALARLSNDDDQLAILRSLVEDDDAHVRVYAAKSIMRLRSSEGIPLLRRLAQDPDLEVRRGAIGLLASVGDKESAPLMRKVAMNSKAVLRLQAMRGLAAIGLPEDLPLLRQAALDQNSEVRAVAVKALAAFPRSENAQLLHSASLKDLASQVRVEAVRALAGFRDNKDLPVLVEMTKDRNSNVRQEAIVALARFKDRLVAPELRQIAKLGQAVADRSEAVKALAGLRDAADLDLFLELAGDPNYEVCEQAIKGLAALGSPIAPRLHDVIADQDANWAARRAAMEILADRWSPEDIPFLRTLTRGDDLDLRHQAAVALVTFDRADGLSILHELMLGRDRLIAARAAHSIAANCDRQELETFLNQHDAELTVPALAVLDDVLYRPAWMPASA